ncbi:hypothetical protein QEZ52_22405 (plasmid) [Aliisedimentitalea scapharcae]|uniref:DUF502 domain-containing protein n=1 Tax=Aliisedimentitalea scapharcae TaxID=1524259 RepID=A0ABZ2XZ35_9RHOB|nr:hypothetical protein K3727_22305 [Rhodobacteraceae bacterium M382]
MKNTMLRGLLFVIPVGILLLVLGQVFMISMKIAETMDSYIPADRIAGIAMSNILALLIVLLTLFAAGMLSYVSYINDKVILFDRALSQNMPGYLLIRGLIGSPHNTEDLVGNIKSVIVTSDNWDRIGFEIERFDDQVIVFFPNQPSVVSGVSVIVNQNKVRSLDIAPRQLFGLLQVHGRGLGQQVTDQKDDI